MHAQASVGERSIPCVVVLILSEDQYDALQEMRQHRRFPGKGHRNPRDRWEAWLDETGIDEDQVAAILEAMETLRSDMWDLHGQLRARELTWEEAREAAEGIRAAFQAELESILTAEQFEALQELRPDCGPR